MTHGCVTATEMCANSTDCVGVLLLLLQLQFSQTKPIDFICDPEVRRRMDVTETLEPLMTHCLDQLPSDVLQPCVRINMGAWKQTSFQQKQAFVRDSLDAFLRSLGNLKDSLSTSCQTDVLKLLERSVKNHLLIVEHLERRISTLTPERDCEGHKTSSLTQTVRFYRKLLRGPVELLMKDLTHMCTTHT
uniref:Thrombopoietin n=1 Tax=Cyprinus carpio TaxID=7962 RepID=A0A8C2A2J8_CYPCA